MNYLLSFISALPKYFKKKENTSLISPILALALSSLKRKKILSFPISAMILHYCHNANLLDNNFSNIIAKIAILSSLVTLFLSHFSYFFSQYLQYYCQN